MSSSTTTSQASGVLLLGLLLAFTSCNGGSSSGSVPVGPPVPPPGTGGGGGGIGGGNPPPAVETKVLFLGNSYTAQNELAILFRNLAADRGRQVTDAKHTPGGNTLGEPQAGNGQHSTNPTSLAMIASEAWDYVVLQEQSTTPTIPFKRDNFMMPGAQSLDASIKANDPATTTLLFQTWGRQNGGQFCGSNDCSPVFASFEEMQDEVTAAYADVGALIGAPVAPVGEAWRVSRALHPGIALHQADASHPTHEGSYLAACVFYAKIFGESPVGISYAGPIDLADAALLQDVAARAVFGPTCGITEYGAGASAVNTLELTAVGDPALGGSVDLAPKSVPETGWWCVSSRAEAGEPLLGGIGLVDLTEPVFGAEFKSGTDAFTVPMPVDPVLTGVAVYFQALAPDATQPMGFALSNGVRIEICP